MPGLLGHAELLVVSKLDNEQNSGNFPIKIGEYLATGVPIVCTKVGEIPKFIIDGQTGYLSKPNSVESFYLKMNEALTDYEKAREIGLKGKEIAEKIFGYKIQAKIMTDFIKKINLLNGD
jgi:glycosyltransferase involved in cell wall biosynthesis